MPSRGARRALHLAAWVAVLTVAAAAGFGFGAMTYHPPEPEMEGMPSGPIEPTGSVGPSPAGEPDVVPDLVGRHRVAAGEALDELDVLYLVQPVKGKDDDVVVRQNPAAGQPVKPSTNVLLSVRCEPRPCPQPPEGRNLYDPCACLWR